MILDTFNLDYEVKNVIRNTHFGQIIEVENKFTNEKSIGKIFELKESN